MTHGMVLHQTMPIDIVLISISYVSLLPCMGIRGIRRPVVHSPIAQ